MYSNNLIRNKSNIIKIQPKKINEKNQLEYDLTSNLFDPFKSSPPNEFINKLHARINKYNNNNHIKLDNCVSA
jgi:hypothetical protein